MPGERVVSRRGPSRIALATGVALALVALAACGGQHRVTVIQPASSPTATPSGLMWRTLTMPQGYNPRVAGLGNVSVARASAANAAVCVIATQGSPAVPQVWTTRDSGATWAPTVSLTGATPAQFCGLQIDDLDPNIMLLSAGNAASSAGYTLLTLDGGATWQPYTAGTPLSEFATVDGVTYATRQAQSGPDLRAHLAVSIDHLQTWQNIDDDIIAADQQVHTFWINPATGDLLAEADEIVTGAAKSQLWQSGDRGAHWAPLADQQLVFFAVQQPNAADWHICGSAGQGTATPAATTRIACTANGGATWTNVALPAGLSQLDIVGMTHDGALLAGTNGANGRDSALYLLPAGSNTWTQQGTAPQSFVQCGAATDGTLLWAFPLNGAVTDGAGNVYVAHV